MKNYNCKYTFYFPFTWNYKKSSKNIGIRDYGKIESATPDWQVVSHLPGDSNLYSYVNDSLMSNHSYSTYYYHSITLQDEEVLLSFSHHSKNYVLKLVDMQIHLFSSGVGVFLYSLTNNERETNTPDDIEYLSNICANFKILIYLKCSDALSKRYPILKRFYDEQKLSIREMRATESEKLVLRYLLSFNQDISISSLSNVASHTFVECLDDNLYSFIQNTSQVAKTSFQKYFGKHVNSSVIDNTASYTGSIHWLSLNKSLIITKEVNAQYTPYIDNLRRLVELVLMQRHTLISIENEIKLITFKEIKKLNKIFKEAEETYQKYIRFSNQFNFEQVSEIQLINDFYQDIQNKMNIQTLGDSVGKKINELYQYISIMEGRGQNIKANKLNVLATIFIPTSIVIGIFGMNSLDGNNQLFYQLLCVLIGLIIGAILTFLLNK